MSSPQRTYLGLFLIAFSTLAVEITLTRLLSVVTWYHLAFFAVSSAMLGMTAGSVTVYLRPAWFDPARVEQSLARAALAYALTLPLSTILLCLIPLQLARSVMSLVALLLVTAVCTLPFYWSGMAIAAVLTRGSLPIGRLYAADLVGASLGCVLVLAGLEVMDAPSLLFVCAAVGALSARVFAGPSALGRRARLACISLAAGALLNASTSYAVRPFFQKGTVQGAGSYLVERWNSFSRVTLSQRATLPPQYWGPSRKAPQEPVEQHVLAIDSDAGSNMRRFASLADVEHLRYDVTNLAYYLRPRGGACVLGVGGGRDLQAALLFGHERVVGVEVNPIIIDLHTRHLAGFSGLAGRPGVSLVVDEARSRLTTDTSRYAVIQMSLIDTWAATGAGAFSLSENGLYTVEGWQVFLRRLSPDGIFTVSRWHTVGSFGETGRLLSLAVASLLAEGVERPRDQIALVSSGLVGTLLVSRSPFAPSDLAELRRVSAELGYTEVVLPDADTEDPLFRAILDSPDRQAVARAVAGATLDYTPATDERPYFFNMLRLRSVLALPTHLWLVRGNLMATLTLLGLVVSLLLLTAVTVLVPLWAARSHRAGASLHWPSAAYFSLIGAGFMFLEIGLLQRFTVFLGHPEYALGVILFTIISSAGVGSFLSDRLPLRPAFPIATAAITVVVALVMSRALPPLLTRCITQPISARIALCVAVLFPLGTLLGTFFPTGMRLVGGARGAETPWYWALNGCFGVLCSALAVLVSVYFGITVSFWSGAACYGLLGPCLVSMRRRRPAGEAQAP